MLVILSGVETIHKKFFARKIIAALNKFNIDGYDIDFTKDPFEVGDKDGKLIYRPGSDTVEGVNHLLVDLDNDGKLDEVGYNTFVAINTFFEQVFLDGVRDNHFAFTFTDLPYDYGVSNELVFNTPEGGYVHPHGYDDLLNNYKNRKTEYFVVTGSFSKGFIDSVKKDIGAENVLAVNITRNPSVCCLLHKKPEAYYIKNTTYTDEFDDNKLSVSIVNSANLKRFDDVVTLRFEDMINEGKFTLNGVEIDLPDGYDDYNGLITLWEQENIVPDELVGPDVIESFNARFLDLHKTDSEDSRFPSNVFADLDYTPLTKDQIISK